MKTLWILDSWDSLHHESDTSLRLIQEAVSMGHSTWVCDQAALHFEKGRVSASCRLVEFVPGNRARDGWRFRAPEELQVDTFEMAHYRVDPPIDRRYLEPLRLLTLAAQRGGLPMVVNPIPVLTRYTEKLGTEALLALLPPTVVSASWERLSAFIRAEGRVVLKPLGEAQSRNVHLLEWTSSSGPDRVRAKLERATDGFAAPVVLQKFLPEIDSGEKRLWFVDGELIACVLKRPAPGTFIIDMDRGASCEPYTLSSDDTRMAAQIGHALRLEGIRLAAVDAIGPFVTDVNLTSPGLIPLMEAVLLRNLARIIVEKLASARAGAGPGT